MAKFLLQATRYIYRVILRLKQFPCFRKVRVYREWATWLLFFLLLRPFLPLFCATVEAAAAASIAIEIFRLGRCKRHGLIETRRRPRVLSSYRLNMIDRREFKFQTILSYTD